MNVLLTGANGFVGSHILDCLRARGFATTLLLRPSSDRRFIAPHLAHVAVCAGSIEDEASVGAALRGVTHVIHCAGVVRARSEADYDAINRQGTRNVVEAVNAAAGQVERLLLVSSLAAAHAAPATAPAHEADPSHPVSTYGRSKLAAEQEVAQRCRVPFTVLRPPPVYGPRDKAFLALFKLVRAHLVPSFHGGIQELSLVFAPDLAAATVMCLTHPAAAGRTYFVASPEMLTLRRFCGEIARQLGVWTLKLPVPVPALRPVCALSEFACRAVGRPSLLNRQKYAELRAPGWVCDATRLKNETGFVAATPLTEGLRQTIAWYRERGWL